VVELAYLLCYPVVPTVFLIVWVQGAQVDVERFWLAVLLAAYMCYGSLPWLVSRPPRLLDVRRSKGLASLNVLVLSRVSHRFNTFPSGHVAVAAAAAAAVATVSAGVGVVSGAIAGAITVGAAAGRYHYLLDVILGLAVAIAAVLASRFV
jgi:membrane-associated phospholipid phosphatase